MTKNSTRIGTRVALVCADDDRRASVLLQLQTASPLVSTYSHLAELLAVAEQADVVLIFADGLPTQSLLAGLDLLERMHSGPLVVVVSDRPPAWTPKTERERPAIIVTHRVWMTKGVELLQSRSSTTPPPEYSGPELPFTD